MNQLDLLYFIHPKTFQIIEDYINELKIIIPEKLQGTIIKVSIPLSPYYLLVFLLDDEISLNFITDPSENISDLDISLEIDIFSRELASFFFINTSDFLLYKLGAVALKGDKKLFIPFKKYLDSLNITKNLHSPLEKISSSLQIPTNISENIIKSILNLEQVEKHQLNLLKNLTLKMKNEKIHDLASFVDNFQVFSQNIGKLYQRLQNLQVRNLTTYGRLQIFLKKLNSFPK